MHETTGLYGYEWSVLHSGSFARRGGSTGRGEEDDMNQQKL
jgi:hypothetical protein